MVIVAAAFLAVISALGAAFYQYGILHWRYNTGHILFYYLILPIQMLLLRVVYKERYIAGESVEDNMALSLMFFLVIAIVFHYMVERRDAKKAGFGAANEFAAVEKLY